MRTLYFDCFAGASGNMILGGLIALGVKREALLAEIAKLNVPEVDIEASIVDRSGISSTHVEVKVPHEHVHRHLSDILGIIDASGLSSGVKARASEIFRRLAQAEAKVHGIDIGKVHFHEVGAMDAIVDVVGACIGFELLGVERFACSRIHVGSGFVDMAHGKFPVPPPAVADLLAGIPVYSTEIEGELITPTGAAIIAAVCDSFGQIPEMIGEKIAYGAGTREYKKFPNTLRLILGESADTERPGETAGVSVERLLLLETNVDDLSPQVLGYVMEQAFDIGALDCWFTPIQMKKDRPAVMLSVLCRKKDREALSALIYRETTTLGIRVRETERESLEREIVKVETEFGLIDVKIGKLGGQIVNAMPEYDQVRDCASRHGIAFRAVRDAALMRLGKAGAAAGK